MTFLHLPAEARVATRWRNGGGVTREVVSEPTSNGVGGFHWRISIADVSQDGPFSAFAGCARIITVLRGAGMALTVDGGTHVISRRYEPFAFDGDAVTECRLLADPVIDFNVIYRRDQQVSVDIVRPSGPTSYGPIDRAVIVALDQPAAVDQIALEPLDAVDIAAEREVVLSGGLIAVVSLPGPTASLR